MSSQNSPDGSSRGDYYGTPPNVASRNSDRSPPRILTLPLAIPSKRESSSNDARNPDMVVLVTQTDFYDAEKCVGDEDVAEPSSLGYPMQPISDYCYSPVKNAAGTTVSVCRIPSSPSIPQKFWMELNVVDKSVQNPFDRSLRKYWNQRRRLFSRFDCGIKFDEEGWFSVTPEQIADHVAARTVDLYRRIHPSTSGTLVVMDAFCGCGGNAIAYARRPEISLVVCVDVDRSKLLCAAHNAAIYEIPTSKMVFVECNVLFILEHCYKNGEFILDQPIETPEQADAMMAAMPTPVPSETTKGGYQVGGIDLLPPNIGAVFMDPPWGGIDYKVFGKDGYCLERHMRIPRPSNPSFSTSHVTEGLSDGFFDSFCASEPRNKQERKAVFNVGLGDDNSVNGAALLRLAATAADSAMVIYDIPRNTSRTSLGRAALHAGYSGNCKLGEHWLNKRLKTITAYFGIDWRDESIHKVPIK
jgi:trimethylguanosine synthase